MIDPRQQAMIAQLTAPQPGILKPLQQDAAQRVNQAGEAYWGNPLQIMGDSASGALAPQLDAYRRAIEDMRALQR